MTIIIKIKEGCSMATRTFRIPNISCHHCVMTIKRELGALAGVASVTGDVETKTVTVEWGPPANWEGIRSLLAEINYPPAE
jgi:copper chaperone